MLRLPEGLNAEAFVLLLMWSGGCMLAALSSAALSGGDGPLWLGVAAIIAAQAALAAGRAARLPSWAVWAPALAFAAVGALGRHGTALVLYASLVVALLVVADRFAALAVALSAFCLPATTTLADPIARELARARRDESPLAVASISVAGARRGARRLARVGRALAPSLRRTDAIVRSIADRVLVVLPGGDDEVAIAVLCRALGGEQADLRVGTATFPRDGPTWAALREVARAREQPWPPAPTPRAAVRSDRFARNGAGPEPAVMPERSTSP